jgi:hypothetical protein
MDRATASASWFKLNGRHFTAVTAAYGVNVTEEEDRRAILIEATRRWGNNGLYTRAELVDVETSLLLSDSSAPEEHVPGKDAVGALTLGGIRDILTWKGFEGGFGAGVTVYRVPQSLKSSHGSNPLSFQVFFRLRPPAGSMGRMWNTRMSQPMKIAPSDPHAGHQMN